MGSVFFCRAVDVEEGQEDRVGYDDQDDKQVYDVGPVQQSDHVVAFFKEDVRQDIDRQTGNQEQQVVSQATLDQIRMPA